MLDSGDTRRQENSPCAKPGTLHGVGVGPGDPELLTMKAFRLIKQAPVIAYLVGESGTSQAKSIARLALDAREASESEGEAETETEIERNGEVKRDIAMTMPMSKDRTLANAAYNHGAEQIGAALKAGHDVVFLCEGDPLFFGSFAYVLERLQGEYPCQVVPGISSVNAAASVLLQPMTMLKESFAVVSGRHSDEQIEKALSTHDSIVIMKAGMSRPRILNLLAKTQRIPDATYLEYIGRENQKIIHDISQLPCEPGPYFSLFVVVPKKARRS